MNLKTWPRHSVSIAVVLLLLATPLATVAQAQTGGGYDLTWHTVDGGGSRASGGGYTVTCTAGQHDTGSPTGDDYMLLGGFWGSRAPVGLAYDTYLPLVLRNGP